MTTHVVFVYGSLKAGFHNAHILAESEFIGQAATINPYFMLSGQAFPFLINPTPLSHKVDLSDIIGRVRGEAYEIDDETLARLDRLEGHPDFYRRELVPVRVGMEAAQIAATCDAWVYFLRPDPGRDLRHMPSIMPDEAGFVEWVKAREDAFEAAHFDDGEE